MVGVAGFFAGYGAHPHDVLIGSGKVSQATWVVDEFLDVTSAQIGYLFSGSGVVQRIFQSCQPSQVVGSVVAAVCIDMVYNVFF